MMVVRNGSTKPHLHSLALRIFHKCVKLGLSLEVEWIPRDMNVVADWVSKNPDWDDWEIENWVFNILNEKWGWFTVDRFANHLNRKVGRFNSKIWYPGTEMVDAFSVSWENENNWLVPPVKLIPRVLDHLCVSSAKGCIVVPIWKSATFWTFLMQFRKAHEERVKGTCVFSPKVWLT